jgi:hypothetical protein
VTTSPLPLIAQSVKLSDRDRITANAKIFVIATVPRAALGATQLMGTAGGGGGGRLSTREKQSECKAGQMSSTEFKPVYISTVVTVYLTWFSIKSPVICLHNASSFV